MQVPQLELVFVSVLACEDEAVVNIDGVTADVGTVDGADALLDSGVPNFDRSIPTARGNEIWVLSHILCAEYAI